MYKQFPPEGKIKSLELKKLVEMRGGHLTTLCYSCQQIQAPNIIFYYLININQAE